MAHRTHPLPRRSADSVQPLELAVLARPRLNTSPGPSPLLVIDARSHQRYRQGHVPGSHHIPAARLLSSEPPEGDLILVTETSAEAEDLIDRLHASGYHRRLLYLAAGFRAWAELGLPLQPIPAAAASRPWAAAG